MNEQEKKLAAQKVVALLAKRYPQTQTHLQHANAWELLVATILAAQCTDERVNTVTPALFARWPDPKTTAGADLAELERVVRPTGFYRNKAKNIVGAARKIMQDFDGEVPRHMQGLTSLPGVARKTANVVLFGAFGINAGIAVDTHVSRIAMRIGLTGTREPVKAEKALMQVVPQAEWGNFNHRLVWFGRHVCQARKPLCNACEMAQFCEKNDLPAVAASK